MGNSPTNGYSVNWQVKNTDSYGQYGVNYDIDQIMNMPESETFRHLNDHALHAVWMLVIVSAR